MINEVEDENDSIYCEICNGCGEDGCCSPLICSNHPNGKFCGWYFQVLQEDKRDFETLLFFVEKKNPELLKEFFDNFEDIQKEDEVAYRMKYPKYMNRLEDEGDDYAR